jgi:hypothetical protein
LVLGVDGTVWVWGWNKHGQLGRSNPTKSAIPLRVLGLPPAVHVACGASHSLASAPDNELWSWGSNRYGELGRKDGNYLPSVINFAEVDRSDRIMSLQACGYSSGVLVESGVVFLWGFLKGPDFLDHQLVPRKVNLPKLFVSQFALGLCHVGLLCDDTLGEVLKILPTGEDLPGETRYSEIGRLLARARGDVLHLAQNRAVDMLSSELPKIKCNVAYLVTNTQLLIVNFSQLLVTSASPFPIVVEAHIPQLQEIPVGCDVRIEPKEFRLAPGEVVTVNVTVNVSKSVTENCTSVMELLARREKKRGFFRRRSEPRARVKYFVVLAFPYTPLLNQRSEDTTAFLLTRFCAEGEVTSVKDLLDRAEGNGSLTDLVNSKDYEGRTPLFLAAQAGHLPVVRLLVARGADVNAADDQENTPLGVASANAHTYVVEFLLSAGATLYASGMRCTPEELAFLRAANKLYIGARRQDLTALDEEDLLSLQAALLQKMKAHTTQSTPPKYEVENLSSPSLLLSSEDTRSGSSTAIAADVLAPASPTAALQGSVSRGGVSSPNGSLDKSRVLAGSEVLESDHVKSDVMPQRVKTFWGASSAWPSACMIWHLRPTTVLWDLRLRAAVAASRSVGGSASWSNGVFISCSPEEGALMFWETLPSNCEHMCYCIARAADGKSFRSWWLLSMLIDDVVLGIWGNTMFAGIASVPAESIPLEAWSTTFACPECTLPNPLTCPPGGRTSSFQACTSWAFEFVELSVVLGHSTVSCSMGHKCTVKQVAPNLTLETLESLRLTEEQVQRRLQVGTRCAAGGFSHVYLGKLKDEGAQDNDDRKSVAVKQFIQRKPIMFSFDTPEERRAKEQEIEQGAVVVFRRLHHEVQMLALKDMIPKLTTGADREKDAARLLKAEAFCDKPPYLLTHFFENGDLYRLLHNRFAFPQLDPIWCFGALIDVARGMRFLHTCMPAFCHRDLKSPNIYIVSMDPNAEQRAVIGDMGTVVAMFEKSRRDLVPVTNPAWMAPELIARHPYGLPADVYSFGMVCWEMAHREHPFSSLEFDNDGEADDKPKLREAIMEGQRPPIDQQTAQLFGQPFVDLITKCWSAIPEDRLLFTEIVPMLVQLKNVLVSTKSIQ